MKTVGDKYRTKLEAENKWEEAKRRGGQESMRKERHKTVYSNVEITNHPTNNMQVFSYEELMNK
jgi:hypothetical protein